MFMQTNKVILRQIEREDLAQLRDWRNDPLIRSRTREYAPLNMLNQERWLESLSDRENIMFSICNSVLIGVCGLTHIDWKNRNAEYSYYIGDESSRGKGLGRHIAYLLFEYGFRELGLHRIYGEIYSSAPEILAIDAKLGFKTDGILRDAYFNEGKYWDSHIMSVLDHEWEELRSNYLK